MLEILVIVMICRKISQEAQNSGRSPTLHIVITIILWFGLEFVGIMIGISLRLGWGSYISGFLFAAIGGFISYVIAAHSDYRPRSDYEPRSSYRPQESYLSKDFFTGENVQTAKHAQITIVRENGSLRSPDAWEFFLNGKNVGRAEDGSSITVLTGHRSNVLIARDPQGALSPSFEFSVESGRHSKVLFREGRFVSAKNIGRMS